MDSVDTSSIVQFVVTYKWWFAVAVPFVIAIMVLRARG